MPPALVRQNQLLLVIFLRLLPLLPYMHRRSYFLKFNIEFHGQIVPERKKSAGVRQIRFKAVDIAL